MIIRKRPIFNLKTSLENVPREWLVHVEPHVMRGSWLPCWVWMGATDRNGYPTMMVRDPETGKRKTVMVHRFVAGLFFDYDPCLTVRRTCNTINCVNPAHVQVTRQHHTQGYG